MKHTSDNKPKDTFSGETAKVKVKGKKSNKKK